METQQSYRKSMTISVILHVFLFAILAVGFQFSGVNYVVENSNTPNVINAMVMTAPTAPPKIITPPKPMPSQVAPPPEPVKPQVQPRVMPAEKPVIVPPKKDVIAIDNKKLKKKQQEMLEKQLLADLNKTRVKQKSLKQKALEDAFESEIKNLSAKTKQQARQADHRVNAEREQKAQGQVDKYKALVRQQIEQHWTFPSGVDKNLATKVIIYLAPGGMVLDAEIYQSSGNTALDNSARAAVFKASPLPVPADAEAFQFFKRFVMVFKPMFFQNGEYNSNASSDL